MASSAQIYSTLAMPGKDTGLATLGDLAEMRDVQAQRQAQAQKAQQEAEKAQRDQQKQVAIQDAFARHTKPDGSIDRKALLRDVTAIDYDAGQKIQTGFINVDKAASDERKGELDNENTKWKMAGNMLQALTPQNAPSLFPSVVNRIKGFDPELAEMIGAQYDPERVKAVVGMGTERTEYNNEYKRILDTDESNTKKALNLLSLAKSPEHWQDALEFAKHHGVDDDLAGLGITAEFSPDAAMRAGALTMTPAERAVGERASQGGAGSDYGRFESDFLEVEAAKRGKTVDQLTPQERVAAKTQARKVYGQADDQPSGGAGGMSPYAESNVINRLVTQWQNASKPAVDLNRQVKLMDAGLDAARRGDLAQGAQAVLVTFQKILDPTSVVRESEYARSAAGQALDSRVKGYFEQLSKGGAGIPLSQLEKFAQLAKEAAKAQATGYVDSVKARIGKSADHFRIPRELIFEDFDLAAGAPTTAPATPAAPGATQAQPKPKKTVEQIMQEYGGKP